MTRKIEYSWGLRPLAFLCLLAPLAQALAQLQPVEAPSPAKSLQCLVQPTKKLRFPAGDPYDRTSRLVRVQLHFEKPDAAPRVELLANTAREDMVELVQEHVSKYRLPCLAPGDGTVRAVQEFNFTNTEMQPLPTSQDSPAPKHCVVMPVEDMSPPRWPSDTVEHVMMEFTFDGDGKAAPSTKIIFSTGMRSLEESVREWVDKYRAPCRKAGDPPFIARQNFTFHPPGKTRFVLKREVISLADFLSSTQLPQGETESIYFDFNTMNCPFLVNYTSRHPHLPNDAVAGSPADPNRLALVKWLSSRSLKFTSKRQANELFNATLQIQIPCGVLDLSPKT